MAVFGDVLIGFLGGCRASTLDGLGDVVGGVPVAEICQLLEPLEGEGVRGATGAVGAGASLLDGIHADVGFGYWTKIVWLISGLC